VSFKNFILNYPALFLIAFVEGGVVMAIEILCGHILTASFGSSVYLWSGILGTSLAGLAAGYYIGSLTAEKATMKRLYLIAFAIALFTASIFPLKDIALPAMTGMELKAGITAGCLLLIFPALLLCGIVSPYIIQIITSDEKHAGRHAGTVYSISTAGGIVFTFATGFFLIPFAGIKMSILILAGVLLLALVPALLNKKK